MQKKARYSPNLQTQLQLQQKAVATPQRTLACGWYLTKPVRQTCQTPTYSGRSIAGRVNLAGTQSKKLCTKATAPAARQSLLSAPPIIKTALTRMSVWRSAKMAATW